jgi:hypothetical protein
MSTTASPIGLMVLEKQALETLRDAETLETRPNQAGVEAGLKPQRTFSRETNLKKRSPPRSRPSRRPAADAGPLRSHPTD